MNRKRGIDNYISIVLLALCVILSFSGFISIADKSMKKSVKTSMKDVLKELKDIDDDQLDEIDEYLEDYNVSLSAKKVVSVIKQGVNIFKDGEFSPLELAQAGFAWLGTGKDIEDAIDETASGYLLGDVVIDMVEGIGDACRSVVLIAIISFVYFVILVITLIGDIKNGKGKKFVLAGASLVLFVCNLFTVSKVNGAFASYIYRELDIDKMVKATAIPFILLLIACVLVAVDMFKDGINGIASAQNISTPMMAKPSAGTVAGTTAGMATCVNCGSTLNPGSAFCPSCGSKVEESAYQTPSQGVSHCGGCGNPLEPGVAFCPNCGKRNG